MNVNVNGLHFRLDTTLVLEADGFRKLDILHTILKCFFYI